ncbi:MAG TPA: glycosyltransferase family 39 protein [Granulicella sp.]|nr:glycosyltransferase family 39 protein [Granulicella sp.]
MIAVLLAFIAILLCYSRGYLLLYGDAVAHLGNARRILDSRNPGLSQLGGVWLPLPHLLMLPFVQKMAWWQNGLAGTWPSLLCYVAGVAGFYRLARRLLVPRWAVLAAAFYAVNPNLLYLSTTAMTEPLFLALLVWLTLLTVECVDVLRSGMIQAANRKLILIGLLIFAAVFTRYDGWVLGAAIWCVLAWQVLRDKKLRVQVAPAFAVFTVITVAGPLLWLAYNQHFFHDPLDFMRGPYSAAAIEKRTSSPGAPHYRGWHNLGWALIFYTRTAQVDAAAWETGFALMAAALLGLYMTIRRSFEGAHRAAILLWLPLPFYLYSVAYGSVPIFIPQLYPHSYYNSRYGMEMLPGLALFAFVAVAALERVWAKSWPRTVSLMNPVVLLLVLANSVAMIFSTPLVLKEGIVNATTRVPFESAIARQLESYPVGVPILMFNSDHIGALQQAGIPLKQTVNEGDRDSWEAALAAPAEKALYVVAIAGDPVAKAVAKHPEGLTELTVLCTTGQPCARIYKSDRYGVEHAVPHP